MAWANFWFAILTTLHKNIDFDHDLVVKILSFDQLLNRLIRKNDTIYLAIPFKSSIFIAFILKVDIIETLLLE